MAVTVLIVDDEPDVEALFRQQFRRDLRAERFVMHFAASAKDALERVANATEQEPALVFSDINRDDGPGDATQDEGNAA